MELTALSLTKGQSAAPANAGRASGDIAFAINDFLSEDQAESDPAQMDALNEANDTAQSDTAEVLDAEDILTFLPPANGNNAVPPSHMPSPLTFNRLAVTENTPLPARVDLMAATAQSQSKPAQSDYQSVGVTAINNTTTQNTAYPQMVDPQIAAPQMAQSDISSADLSDGIYAQGKMADMPAATKMQSLSDYSSAKAEFTAKANTESLAVLATNTASADQSDTNDSRQQRSAKTSFDLSALDPNIDMGAMQKDAFNSASLSANPVVTGNESAVLGQFPSAVTPPQSSPASLSGTALFAQSETPVQLDQSFAERIGKEIAMMTKTERGISLQISPANLGVINIEIMAGADGDRVRLTSENMDVRQMILQTQARIEQDMRQAGQKIAGFEVAGGGSDSGLSDNEFSGGDMQQNMADNNQDRAEKSKQKPDFYTSAYDAEIADEKPVNMMDQGQVRFA